MPNPSVCASIEMEALITLTGTGLSDIHGPIGRGSIERLVYTGWAPELPPDPFYIKTASPLTATQNKSLYNTCQTNLLLGLDIASTLEPLNFRAERLHGVHFSVALFVAGYDNKATFL